jgi:TPR repeat protein
MFNLGHLYAELMQPPDLDAARHWWERAADTRHSEAMFNLAYLYANLIQPPDLDAARHWYERGADAGNNEAMFNSAPVCGIGSRRIWTRPAAGTSAPPIPGTTGPCSNSER